ncbi:sulfotransferase [Kordiimonas sp. SCSIO 12603]|uniref:sulfotransferase family protein n=1 Tax=Kordiimonas sp. SCSIO 12603 TaxID=2829596 RepID=UPI0021044C89|nr:sulfotransferase [Kordiimonas sp. SCSIO 12603]UTW57912.1 sulfotransferase [Kordiimonas sp. SCSIO 12603]
MIKDSSLLFLGGAPRSGTTWVQLLLFHSGLFASSQETHLFSGYLKSLQNSWSFYSSDKPARDGVGIGAFMDEATMLTHAKAFTDHVLAGIAKTVPNAPFLLEKTPSHIQHTDFIWQLYPAARMVHIVRDPRAVVASLIAASNSWAGKWAAPVARKNIWTWKNHIAKGREIENDPRVYTLKYEDLLQSPVAGLRELYRWLGKDIPDAALQEAIDACALDKVKDGKVEAPWKMSSEPKGFYRKAGTDAWKNELSREDIMLIEELCSEEMVHYGYEVSQ